MTPLEVLSNGTIDDQDSAFPQAAQLPDGRIICTYSNAGGQFATGGTDASWSTDGSTWTHSGTVVPASTDPPSTNFLKVSSSADGTTLYLYGARSSQTADLKFGERWSEAIVCTSADGGSTWATPRVVPMPTTALEISHGILALGSGRLLAPAATIEPGRLGERIVLAVSDDGGQTWPRVVTAMQDPDGAHGYLEHKLAALPDGRVLLTAWTVTLDDVSDRPNSSSISEDGGDTWSTPASMGIRGQTLSAVHLDSDRFLLLYNRRYGAQGIVAAIARLTDDAWAVDHETLLHDTERRRDDRQHDAGVDEMLDFEFGFPTAIRLQDGHLLATYWSVEDGRCGVRWARMSVAP